MVLGRFVVVRIRLWVIIYVIIDVGDRINIYYCNVVLCSNFSSQYLYKESLNNDGQHFDQYQQNQVKSLNIEKDHDIWHYKYRSWHGTGKNCGWVKPANGIPTLF